MHESIFSMNSELLQHLPLDFLHYKGNSFLVIS